MYKTLLRLQFVTSEEKAGIGKLPRWIFRGRFWLSAKPSPNRSESL